MKAKTAVSTLLALALSATVCAGLAGCGEKKNDDKNNGGTQTQKPAVDNSKYTVTKAEWENAFDFSDKNCTVTTKVKSTGENGFELTSVGYFIGGTDAWSKTENIYDKSSAQELSEGINMSFMIEAAKVYNYFAYDETTQSYKSTGSWYNAIEEGEDHMQLVGEVKFENKKLIYCNVNYQAVDVDGSSDPVTMTTSVTNYGATVKPADAPDDGEE